MRRATRLTGPILILVSYFGVLAGAVWGLRNFFPSLMGHLPFGGIKSLGDEDGDTLEIVETFVRKMPCLS